MTREHPGSVGRFSVVERRVDHVDCARLLRAFYNDQLTRYDTVESVDLDPAVYAPPSGTFVVCYDGDRPVGCAGCRWYDRRNGVVEIKKVFLVAEVRGRGLGRLLLAWLEAWASERGAEQAIVETGVRNTSAIALWRGSGYQPTASYAPGRDPAINRAFVRHLASPPVVRSAVGSTSVR